MFYANPTVLEVRSTVNNWLMASKVALRRNEPSLRRHTSRTLRSITSVMHVQNARRLFALTAAGVASLAQSSVFAQAVPPTGSAAITVETGSVTMTPVSTSSVSVGANGGSAASSSASATASATVGVSVSQQARDEVGAALQRIPLRFGVHGSVGWTSSLDRPALDGYAIEAGGSLGVWALPWLAIEARGTYLSLTHRIRDANGDGRADVGSTALEGLLLGAQVRFRLLEDELRARRAWSFALGGGALVPFNGTDGRGPGPVFEAAIARHVGVLNGQGSAFDVSVELRGRMGVGPLGDYQSILAGVSAAWEGRQLLGPVSAPSTAYRPGHTISFQGMGGWFFSDGTRPGTNIHFGGGGGGMTATGGLVLAAPIELIARGGYLGRAPANKPEDWLHFGFVEGGLRARWYLFYLEAAGGIFAPFGTFRDRVDTGGFVSATLGLRVPLVAAQDPGGRFLAGIRTQFGVGSERSFDGIFFTAGFEFEGGNHHASFPRFNVSTLDLNPAGGVGVGVGVAGGGSIRGSGSTGVGITRTQYPGPSSASATTSPAVPAQIIPIQPTGPSHIPLSIRLGMHTGYIAPIPNVPLQRTLFDLSLTASWAVSHWLAFDVRSSWTSAAARTEDLTGDGLADVSRPGFGGVQLSIGPRFRWLTDTDQVRFGWSAGVAGGVILPTFGSLLARGPGATMDLVLARDVGVLLGNNAAFGASLELRARTGFGAWGDYQSLLIGGSVWWEGNVRGRSTANSESPNSSFREQGWRPGHTFTVDGGAAIFLFGAKRANGADYFSTLGAHVGVRAGITFTQGFEWFLRGGYFNRPGANNHDDLAAVTLETGPRARIGWLSARAMLGYAAVIGTQRDEISSGLYAGAGFETRFAINDHFRFVAGIEARFALREERATDHIGITAGFEFEGGRHRAVDFPRANREPQAPQTIPNEPTYLWRTPGENTTRNTPGPYTRTVGASGGVAIGGRVDARVTGSAAVSLGVTVPMRFALSIGPFVGSRGLGSYTLDGSGGAYNLTAAWVPTRWFSLDLTGGILACAGYTRDSNGDGQVDTRTDGLTHFTLSAGPRFRVLTDDQTRFGWSFHAAGGVIGSAVGVGPLGEFAIARHLAAVTDSHMAFEIGVEARARVGYEPHSAAMGDQGSLFHAVSLGLVGAWEANVHRNSSPTTAAQLGETLSIEAGGAVFISSTLRNGRALNAGGWAVAARTGLVFTRGFEWSARGQFVQRPGEKGTSSLEMLLVETGPRMRLGWAYGELGFGYAGAFGAYRDEISSSFTASVGAGVRFGLSDDSHPSGGVTAGVQARFGVGPERAFDALFLTAGFEFEGGRRRAAPFPEMNLTSPRVPQAVEIATTSPRYQATGGQTTVVTGIEVPQPITVQPVPNGGVSVGVSIGGSLNVDGSRTALSANTSVNIERVASQFTVNLDAQTLYAMLPPITPEVSTVEVELRTPNGANALAAETALRDAMSRRYGSMVRCIPRILLGATTSGGWEMTARAQ